VNNGFLKTMCRTYNFSTYGHYDCDCLFDLQDDSQGYRTICRTIWGGAERFGKLQGNSQDSLVAAKRFERQFGSCRTVCRAAERFRELQSDSQNNSEGVGQLKGLQSDSEAI